MPGARRPGAGGGWCSFSTGSGSHDPAAESAAGGAGWRGSSRGIPRCRRGGRRGAGLGGSQRGAGGGWRDPAPGSFVGVDAFLRRTDIRRQRGLRLAAVLLLVAGLGIGWSTSFRYSNLRSGSASWSRSYAGLGSPRDVASSAAPIEAGHDCMLPAKAAWLGCVRPMARPRTAQNAGVRMDDRLSPAPETPSQPPARMVAAGRLRLGVAKSSR